MISTNLQTSALIQFLELRFAEIKTDEHAEAVNYFIGRYPSTPGQHRPTLLKGVFSYLASRQFPTDLLGQWCSALETAACDDERSIGSDRTIILYGLHTLILQNNENRDHTRTIYTVLNRLMTSQRNWFRPLPFLSEWIRGTSRCSIYTAGK